MQSDGAVVGRLGSAGVVAVLTVERVADAVPLARALVAGGVTAMELTLRTPAAADALRAIVTEVPEMYPGVGTVLRPDQVREIKTAGACFGVAPGLNPTVLKCARDEGLFFMPGVATPSDVEAAVELGCSLMKFFPAERIGGLPYLTSMAGPYKHLGLRFMPLGGVNAENMAGYLGSELVFAVGGSWLARPARIAAGDWTGIEQTAREAMAIARSVRPGG